MWTGFRGVCSLAVRGGRTFVAATVQPFRSCTYRSRLCCLSSSSPSSVCMSNTLQTDDLSRVLLPVKQVQPVGQLGSQAGRLLWPQDALCLCHRECTVHTLCQLLGSAPSTPDVLPFYVWRTRLSCNRTQRCPTLPVGRVSWRCACGVGQASVAADMICEVCSGAFTPQLGLFPYMQHY